MKSEKQSDLIKSMHHIRAITALLIIWAACLNTSFAEVQLKAASPCPHPTSTTAPILCVDDHLLHIEQAFIQFENAMKPLRLNRPPLNNAWVLSEGTNPDMSGTLIPGPVSSLIITKGEHSLFLKKASDAEASLWTATLTKSGLITAIWQSERHASTPDDAGVFNLHGGDANGTFIVSKGADYGWIAIVTEEDENGNEKTTYWTNHGTLKNPDWIQADEEFAFEDLLALLADRIAEKFNGVDSEGNGITPESASSFWEKLAEANPLTSDAQSGIRNLIGSETALAINARDHGVTGDGETDDTAAIQAILDSLSSTNFRQIYFPSGTYKISKALEIKEMGTKILGDSWDTTHFVMTDPNENMFEWPRFDKGVTTIKDIHLIGTGGDSSNGSAIYSRRPNGNFYMSDLTLEHVKIEGFLNAVWVENFPKLISRNTRIKDCVVGYRLTKADTFLIQNSSIGDVSHSKESWGFIIERSGGSPGGHNFGGIIDLGEFGDLDHFMLCTSAFVSVREPNLERIHGSYVVRAGQLSRIDWYAGRLANEIAEGTPAVFSLDASSPGGFAPELYVYGTPHLGAAGYRGIEIFGAHRDNANVRWFGASPLKAFYTPTAGGAIEASFRPGVFSTRRIPPAMAAGENQKGNIYQHIPNENSRAAEALYYVGRDETNTYKLHNLVNDGLMRVPQSTVDAVGNEPATPTTLYQQKYQAYEIPSKEWSMRIQAFGKFASNSNSKYLKVLIDNTILLFDTTSLKINGADWELDITVVMKNGSNSLAIAKLETPSPLVTNKIQISEIPRGFVHNTDLKIIGYGTDADDVRLLYAKTEILKPGSKY